LKLIDPPLAPEAVAKPKRMLILAVSIVLGLMIGAMVAIIRGSRRKTSQLILPENDSKLNLHKIG